jgi:hypothetical protein
MALRSLSPAAFLSFIFVAWINLCAVGAASPPGSVSWPGTDLFTNDRISHIRIQIGAEELARLRKEPREFVHATVEEAATIYPDVAVHLKGSVGSFRAVDDKPGLTLDFARFQTGQRFHGLRRIHLNNSVEDPSYCNEQLGSELFRMAQVPAPRVTRAVVALNERRLGLYVVKEGFTEDFLSCYYRTVSGDLFEPGEGHDVNQHLKRTSIRAPAQGRDALHRLSEIVLESDPAVNWQRLQTVLDTDEFLRFMALEIMLCHRDGYCLARNNFRVYQDLDTGKFVFFPHGMDQLFGIAELPWIPHMAGLVAAAVMKAPRGNQGYRDTFRALFGEILRPDILTNRVNQLTAALRSHVDESEFNRIAAESARLNQKILDRYLYLDRELPRLAVEPMDFMQGECHLAGWVRMDEPKAGLMEQSPAPDGVPALRILVHSEATPSWRTKRMLAPGRYRFEGKVFVQDVKPLSFGEHQGAGIRINGQVRQVPDLLSCTNWQMLSAEFEVSGVAQEVEFICELRASAGQAWFDSNSLKVIKEP